jgi:cyclase
MDVKRVDGVFTVFAKGGRENTGINAIEWAKEGYNRGAGELVVNSIDTDGIKKGFDIEMLYAICNVVDIPVIASGGAGCAEDFVTLFKTLKKVDAGLAASIFHFKQLEISELKKILSQNNIPVRQ